MVWYGNFLITSLSYYNWIHDLWFNFTHRLGKAWFAYNSTEGVWHIYNNNQNTYVCAKENVSDDEPQYIYNVEDNHLIDTSSTNHTLQPSNFIGGSLYFDGAYQDDLTDFISSLRIIGSTVLGGTVLGGTVLGGTVLGSTVPSIQVPSIQVLIYAWAIKTGKSKLGWLMSRREPFEVRMVDRNADDVVFTL